MNERAGFLNAILADPDEDLHREAYADWLRERPGAFDQAHGRFIAAGLTLHHIRSPEKGREGVFSHARRDQNETAPVVLRTQIEALLGWVWGPSLSWSSSDEAPGRVILQQLLPSDAEAAHERRNRRRQPWLQPSVMWARGCVSELCLPIRDVLSHVPTALAHCPVERITVSDEPGLSFSIRSHADGDWVFGIELVPPPSSTAGFPHSVPGSGGLVRYNPPVPRTHELRYSTRDELARGFQAGIQALINGIPAPDESY